VIDDILVSVAVISYNHEKFINQALDSILAQKVDFKYEIIIGDDCSTDRTPEIISEYEKKYPGLIKRVYREKNVGPTKNLYEVFHQCKGKYIAQLEGDDFWSDELKLKKQINFLEVNQLYIGVAHSCNVLCDEEKIRIEYEEYCHCKQGTVFGFNDFKKKYHAGHTSSMVYRNIYLNNKDTSIIYEADSFIGDVTINLMLVLEGNIFCMSDHMSVYRVLKKIGGSNFVSKANEKNILKQEWVFFEKLNQFSFEKIGKKFILPNKRAEHWLQALIKMIKTPSSENISIFLYFSNMVMKHLSSLPYIPVAVLEKLKKLYQF
jgi:glycosyltransferase involved in cell wall biosynthesis